MRIMIAALLLMVTLNGCLAQQQRVPFSKAESFAYVLQAEGLGSREEALQKLESCKRSVLVIDYSYDGSHDQRWTSQEIGRLRKNHVVLAYFSIGEAEDYRYYWRKKWDPEKDGKPDKGAPGFLCGENPDWGGNYRVKYWQTEWQKVILDYLDHILAQGFDGVYLDIVDAFEGFEFDGENWVDHRLNKETGHTYRQDMIRWVKSIRAKAREKNSSFLIVPQNGMQLLEDSEYVKLVDGIGVESLFAEGNKKRKADERKERLQYLSALKSTDKPVLAIDYSKDKKLQDWVKEQARREGYCLLFAERALNTLGRAVK